MPNNPTLSKNIWPFSPQSIASCVLWLDAADSNSVQLSGTSVTQWTDKSGKGNNATTSYPPTYVSNSQNNLATISFDGYSTYFDCPLTVDFSTHCFFAVHNPVTIDPNSPPYNAPGGNTSILRFQNTNGYIVFPYTFEGTYGYINDHGGPIFGGLPDGSSAGAFQIISANISNGNSATYVNGVKQVSVGNNISGGQSDTLSIGAYGVAPLQGQYYWGSIAEILVFSCHLTDEERHQIDGYLAWKWNLGPLPTGHPYYGRPVFSRIFQPVDIPGCQLWLDGADQSSMTFSSGTTVSTWNDKSGSGYNATVLSGYTGATFSSSSSGLYFPNSTTGYATSYSANPTNETMFVVFNNPSPSGNNNIVIGGTQGARSLAGGYSGTEGVGACSYLNNQITWNGIASMPASTYTSGSTVIITGQVIDSYSSAISQNGGTVYTNSGTTFNQITANTYIGTDTHYNPPLFYYNGYIMEVIFYNSVLTPSQCQQVESYLASKWNLQPSLPTTHPGYRLSAYSVAKTINITFSPIALTNLGVWLDPSDFEAFTLSGSNVTDITSKALDINQNSQWYSPYGGVIQRTINSRTAFGFPGVCLRNDYLYFPNGYNMSIFAIAQIPTNRSSISIFSKGIIIQLKTDGIDVIIISDDYTNAIFFANTNGNQMPTDTNNIYFISLVITTPEDTSQASCYCTINGVQLSMGIYDYWSTAPYDTETYLIIDFGQVALSDTPYDATIGESIIYTDHKSIAECQRMEGYLAWKWGAQSLLPSIHPYAFTPP
jgi:hypothetical protein